MPKKPQKQVAPPSSSSSEGEDYDSESYSEDQMSGKNERGLPELTSREHLMNYESDSSDDDHEGGGAGDDSSMDLAVGLKK